ncbi:MAG: alpha/beta hydrolase [Rubrivivax sp.]|nr:alpha/beta hydrolase [Rubrivivax sp.]
MNPRTQRLLVPGPAGSLQCALDEPEGGQSVGMALLCHPHPQHGGTMDNKVVQTLARAFLQLGWRTVRFNFRGVGESAGHWDRGIGEIDDARAVLTACRKDGERLALGGFSFGASVATHVAQAFEGDPALARLLLVGPAVVNFPPAPVSPATGVVHGERDEVVPLAAVMDWARPQGLPVMVLPGAGHFFHGQLAVLKQILLTLGRS